MRPLPDSMLSFSNSCSWIREAPFESNFYHALSIILPEYEKRMIEFGSLANVPHEAECREDLVRFMKQESNHRKIHNRYNKHLEGAHYSFSIITRLVQSYGNFVSRYFPLSLKIGICASGEHLTGVVATYFINHYSRYKDTSDQQICQLWRWHVVEEIEHKTTMHSVMELKNYGYFSRMLSCVMIDIWLVLPMVLFGILLLSAQDRSLWSLKFWKNAFSTLLGSRGLLYTFLYKTISYFRPRFRPQLTVSEASFIKNYDSEVIHSVNLKQAV
ncbi:MAG TPA: metal-dependent hydrolase [Oligoflexus sp.]|uniref:metal-dependent hydrolase n=1 Tax=Oligoflexus sp. TaxID=1971216 RepID=UPI002D55E8EC|nr:metal-dependent hydrolase [Oligoflexus sp.]HYX33160.1 metal-dependent hydrolase [Oligoflexus sp.]